MDNIKLTCAAKKTVYYSDDRDACFYSALKDFMYDFGCIYLSFVLEDVNKGLRLGYTSNPDWQQEYIGNKLIENCHLWKTVNTHFIETKHQHLILPWSTVNPVTSTEKDIFLYREEFDIGRGVSFCRQKDGFREFFSVNPERKNKQFERLVARNLDLIRKHVKNFREVSNYELSFK